VGAVTVWGDFEVHLDQLLGRGGMGSVYRAWQKSLGRWTAVKVLDTAKSTDTLLVQGFLQKFKVEIAALAKLNDPRIVSIIQAGENDGRCWFAMELLDGRTLEARLGDSDLLSESEARRLGGEVARALGAAWKGGIVHRDVKPGNIFLLKDGAVKIADFGLARSTALGRTRLTDAGAFACTPAYASPEQIEGRATDHRSDIYSLGCVLYEMVTQRPPFLSDNHLETLSKHKLQKPVSLRTLNPGVSTDYEDVVLRCLEKHPDDRWGAYEDLVEALDRPRPASVRLGSSPAEAELPIVPRKRSRALGLAAVSGLAGFTWILATVLGAQPPADSARETAPIRRPEPLIPPLPPHPGKAVVETRPPPVLEKPKAYRPSEAELAFLEKTLALSRATLAARMAYAFEDAAARLEEIARRPEITPWAKERATAEAERARAAAKVFPPGPLFAPGADVTLVLRDGRTLRGKVVDEDGERVRLDVDGGTRVAVRRESISPLTFPAGREARIRAAAGDAIGALGDLGEAHGAGATDQAIEEAMRAAESGDFRPLRGLKVSKAAREALEPALGARFRLLDEERGAAELREKGALAELLLEKPLSRAAGRSAAEALEDFTRSLPDDPDTELVGEVAWQTWEPDTFQAPGGSARFEGKAYALAARRPGDAAWIKKPFEGAKRGYRVTFAFPSPDDGPVLAAAISFTRWIEIGPSAASLKAAEAGQAARVTKRLELGRKIAGGRLTVAPKDGLTLIWLDERLLFALPASEVVHEAGMQLGALGGAVRIDGIRVKDRTR
jgi:serine/threonine protein kinase